MSTLAIDNFKPSAGGTSFGIEGIAKSFYAYDQTTPTILSSGNISSITDNSAGDHTANLTNSYAAADYGVGDGQFSSSNGAQHNGVSVTTSSYRYQTKNASSVEGDNSHSSTQTFGDLA